MKHKFGSVVKTFKKMNFYLRFWDNNQVFFSDLNVNEIRLCSAHILSVGNGDFDFHSRFDVDGCDLLHNFTWWVQINDTLVDAHLEAIPGLTTFTARCFTGSDAEHLGWPTDWTLDTELLLLCSRNQIGANLFQWTNIGGCQGYTNAVNSRWLTLWLFQIFSLSCLKYIKIYTLDEMQYCVRLKCSRGVWR